MTRYLISRPLLPSLFSMLIALAVAWGTLSPPGVGHSPLPFTDKQLHALAFALLILPLALTNLRRAVRVAPICVLFGALIEVIQPTVGRTAEWADLGADIIGVMTGLALGFVANHLRLRA